MAMDEDTVIKLEEPDPVERTSIGPTRPPRVQIRSRQAMRSMGGGDRAPSVASTLLGIFAALTCVGTLAGTVIHAEHAGDTRRNWVCVLATAVIAFKCLYPLVAALIRVPGYSLPVEVQDIL